MRVRLTAGTIAVLSLLLQATPVQAQSTAGPNAQLGQSDQVWLAAAALTFGVVAIGAVLFFLFRDRLRSFDTLNRLALGGRRRVGVASEPALSESRLTNAVAGGPEILGPSSIRLGESTTFHSPGSDFVSIRWKLAGDGTLSTDTGPRTTVTGTAIGVLRLTASATPIAGSKGSEDSPNVPAVEDTSLDVVVTAPDRHPEMVVPFLGSGYGSVVLGLAVAAVTAALGLTKVIQGEAVATILGALVSYSVARSATSSSAAAASPSSDGTVTES